LKFLFECVAVLLQFVRVCCSVVVVCKSVLQCATFCCRVL